MLMHERPPCSNALRHSQAWRKKWAQHFRVASRLCCRLTEQSEAPSSCNLPFCSTAALRGFPRGRRRPTLSTVPDGERTCQHLHCGRLLPKPLSASGPPIFIVPAPKPCRQQEHCGTCSHALFFSGACQGRDAASLHEAPSP